MKSIPLIVASLVAMAGCSSTPDKPDAPVSTNRAIRAVCIGIGNVDPDAYGGWDGYCPGTEFDANLFAGRFTSLDIPTTTLLTKQATRANILDALTNALSTLVKGDLLIVTLSGHGGQTPGTLNETDGLDEYVCAYDGPILDNTINEWLRYVPKGVCVLWICDTCHSGTMHRTVPTPVVFSARSIPKTFQGQLILLSGSAENEYSYGGLIGGVWSQSLLRKGPEGLSPKEWFNAAKAIVTGQNPQYVEYGNVTNLFRNGVITPKQGE